jgi:hypothetical protein
MSVWSVTPAVEAKSGCIYHVDVIWILTKPYWKCGNLTEAELTGSDEGNPCIRSDTHERFLPFKMWCCKFRVISAFVTTVSHMDICSTVWAFLAWMSLWIWAAWNCTKNMNHQNVKVYATGNVMSGDLIFMKRCCNMRVTENLWSEI